MLRDDFERHLERARMLSQLGERIQGLAEIVASLRDVPGDIVEIGSHRGGSALALAAAAQHYPPAERSGSYWGDPPAKKVYAFDLFEGPGIQHNVVKDSLRPIQNLLLVKGDFKHTIPVFRQRQLSLLFLDCEQQHGLAALERFWPWMHKDGMAVSTAELPQFWRGSVGWVKTK